MRIYEGARRIALVAPSYHDAREVMIFGQSGLAQIGLPKERPVYESSRRRLLWPNGAVGYVFSAEDPDGLRGAQFDAAWADEFCAWSYPQETLSNLRLGLRLGDNPRLVLTTTPKPIPALSNLLNEPDLVISRASTQSNSAYLSSVFMRSIMRTYAHTRLGRQELDGDILDEDENGLWSRTLIERARVHTMPVCDKIIIAIDPPVTSSARADACGIIVAGIVKGQTNSEEGQGSFDSRDVAYVLYDGTRQGLSPEKWAYHAVKLWMRWEAEYILVEVNQGGDLVKSVFTAINANIPVRTVYARKSKTTRAEPVAALYEQGMVKHCGVFTELEDELCAMGKVSSLSKDQKRYKKSPDRADALVWAISDLLLLHNHALPRLRSL